MTIGTKFEAKDKLNNIFIYEVVALDPQNKMREYILNNLTTGSITEVEAEWFNQRKIKIIK